MDLETKQQFENLAKRMAEMEERIVERIHDTETRLLRSFADYHAGMDARIRGIEQSDARVLERLAALENRVIRLETEPRR